jgi:hypothetical protein
MTRNPEIDGGKKAWAMRALRRAALPPFGLNLAARVFVLRMAAAIAGARLEILCILACLAIWLGTFNAIGGL